MSLAADLHAYLLAETDITDLVGTAGVYWQRAPQGVAYPFIVFFRVSTDRPGADVSEHAGYVEAVYQFDCYHNGSDDVLAVVEAVRTTLGEIEKTTIGGTYIQSIAMENEREFAEPPEHGQEEVIDRAMIEARIVYNETVPTH